MIAESRPADPLAPGTEGPDRLRDATPVYIRCAKPGDRDLVIDLLRRVSEESIELRYFSPLSTETVRAELLQPNDVRNRLALLIYTELPDRCELIGHGEYVRDGPRSPSAEVAFLIADAYHGRGAASVLLTRLARSARDEGIQRFRAIVLPENPTMVEVFRQSGFPCAIERHGNHIAVTLAVEEEPRPLYPPRRGAPPMADAAP